MKSLLVISSDGKERSKNFCVEEERDIFFRGRRRKLGGAPSRTPPCILSVSYIHYYSTTAAATFFFFFFFLSFCSHTKRKTFDAF
jgi:hypothetical protein